METDQSPNITKNIRGISSDTEATSCEDKFSENFILEKTIKKNLGVNTKMNQKKAAPAAKKNKANKRRR